MSGTIRHWYMARISSLALIPLTLWLIWAGVALAGASHQEAAAFMAHSFNSLAAVLLAGIGLYHSVLGISEVVGDYVPGKGLSALLMWVARLGCTAGFVAVVYALYLLKSGN